MSSLPLPYQHLSLLKWLKLQWNIFLDLVDLSFFSLLSSCSQCNSRLNSLMTDRHQNAQFVSKRQFVLKIYVYKVFLHEHLLSKNYWKCFSSYFCSQAFLCKELPSKFYRRLPSITWYWCQLWNNKLPPATITDEKA